MAGRVDVFDVLQVVADTVRDHSLLLSMAWASRAYWASNYDDYRYTLEMFHKGLEAIAEPTEDQQMSEEVARLHESLWELPDDEESPSECYQA